MPAARAKTTDYLPLNLLSGSTVLITGGGSGIGQGIAIACAASGAKVAVLGRTESRLVETVALIRDNGGTAISVVADVRDLEAVEQAVETVGKELGSISTVIAAAAGNFFAAAKDISSKGFRTVLEIDLMGSFHVAKAAFDQLQETRGNILFVSAGHAYLPITHQAHVGAAKAGIENLMRNLAIEWGQYGIRSNSIVPGPVSGTEGMERLAGPVGEEVWTNAIPLGRFAEIDEIAAMSVVLSSPLSSYVTGAQVVVDGGLGLNGFGSISQAVTAVLDDL